MAPILEDWLERIHIARRSLKPLGQRNPTGVPTSVRLSREVLLASTHVTVLGKALGRMPRAWLWQKTWRTSTQNSNNINKQTALTEKGEIVSGRGDAVNMHDILTGSDPQGLYSTAGGDTTCGNWTKSGADGSAIVGHHDRTGLKDTRHMNSWNSSHGSRGCSQEALKSTGGADVADLIALLKEKGADSDKSVHFPSGLDNGQETSNHIAVDASGFAARFAEFEKGCTSAQ